MSWTNPRAELPVRESPPAGATPLQAADPEIATWYREHFALVFRSLRRLGLADAELDDAVQDVFLVAHRRRRDYDPAGSTRAWLFGIARRIAQRRSRERRLARRNFSPFQEDLHAAVGGDPQQAALRAEASALVRRCLAALDEEKRCVIILADMEAMSGPEIAQALELNLNTAYARLRAARKQFVQAVRRERARAKE